MQRDVWLSAVLLATACSAGLSPSESTRGTPAHGVEVVATVTSQSTTLRITNTGNQDAFLSRCGSSPLVLVQQFAGTEWTGGVQNFACPAPSAPGPISLRPAESISVVRTFTDAGRYRFRVPVGTTQDLNDAAAAVSNAFDVP